MRPKKCEECHEEDVEYRCEKGQYLGRNCVSLHINYGHFVRKLEP